MTTQGVVGSDGAVPVYQPEARWCWWSLSEIYRGSIAAGKYVPKILDYVMDPSTYTTYIVDALDPVTLVPTLREIRPANMNFAFTETDVLFGVGPGTQADTYRAYIDKTNLPHSLAIDTRLRVGGTMCSYCKIFRGSTLDNTGEVISKMYDSNGVFISENVPLELVAIDSHTNYSIKVPAVCKVTADMADGEVVTAVFYTSQGVVVSKRQLMIENSTFIRSLNVSQKYVTHISLESPFLSPTVDNQIDYPLNVPMNALNLIGVVHYNDGSTFKHAVDGTKFTMFGLEQFISSIIGQEVGLVLRYTLGDDEISYVGVGGEGRYVTEPYKLISVNPNNSYSVKLFGYPQWIDEATGYYMRWWLLNLDRNVWFDVTNFTFFNSITGPFDPKGYGYLQKKSVSINLNDVSGAYKPFIHTQVVEVILNNAPNGQTPWLVSHESNVMHSMYGQDLVARLKSPSTVNLQSGIATQEEWLTRVYQATYPLVNPVSEITPLTPTHFAAEYLGVINEFPISSWNADINIGDNIQANKAVSIRFFKRTGNADLQLAVADMIIYG